jgi:cyclohexyl-isocyanide hydratase
MKAAFVIFDRMTALDFVGVYDPLGRLRTMGVLPDFEWAVCAATATVADDRGLRFLPDLVGEPLGGFDLLVVPGGHGTRALRHDAAFLEWLRTGAGVPLKASACTGALLLGAAGFLAGKPATTHPSALRDLEPYGAEVRSERVVDAGGDCSAVSRCPVRPDPLRQGVGAGDVLGGGPRHVGTCHSGDHLTPLGSGRTVLGVVAPVAA